MDKCNRTTNPQLFTRKREFQDQKAVSNRSRWHASYT